MSYANSQSHNLQYVPLLGDTSPGSVWPKPRSQNSSSEVCVFLFMLALVVHHIYSIVSCGL